MHSGGIIRKVKKQQAVYTSLARQGITRQELKKGTSRKDGES